MPTRISVVVPTHNRQANLRTLLEALSQQNLAARDFEVIVVDDASFPPISVPGLPLDVKLVRCEPSGGPGAARNTGWRIARADLIAFIDDDCRPSSDWLRSLLSELPKPAHSTAIIQGPVEPEPSQLNGLTPLSHTIRVGGPDRNFACANIAYSRALLERLGGFDERLTKSGEDVELGARALNAGATQLFAENALVYHEVRQLTLADLLRHTWKWTDSVRVLAMHDELRDLLVLRLFWKRTHPLLLLALAGAASRHRPLTVAAALPYLRHYRRVYSGNTRGMTAALPLHLVVDLSEIATVLVGSLRYRTIML